MTAHPADPQGPKLPCPFCGASPDEQPGSLDYVTCSTEGCIASHGWAERIDWNRRAPAETPALDELFQSANAASSITGRKWMSLEVKHGTFRQALAELRALKGQP